LVADSSHSDASGPTSDVTASKSASNILIVLTEASLQSITPRNAYEALKSTESNMWLLAMNREKECHVKNGTFGSESKASELVKAVPADWVFKIKHRGAPIDVKELTAKQFKARVVVRGQFMREGLNYNDTFAPVAKPTTMRALLAFATKHGCLLKSGDVETAFLTANMDCEVWVKMPPFWGKATDQISGETTQVKPRLLLKGVPGIPQAVVSFMKLSQHTSLLWVMPLLMPISVCSSRPTPLRSALFSYG
jgi:hypothetical protein